LNLSKKPPLHIWQPSCRTTRRTKAGLIIKTLARCKYPKVTETFLNAVTAKTKKAKAFNYDTHFLFNSARFLPPADLPQLDSFAASS